VKSVFSIPASLARRLAITKQRLAGTRPPANLDGILDVMRDLGCLQLDPIGIVARSHQLVLWSRLGKYDLAHLDQLLWQERRLFEYWAHCASIVLTEDYPLFSPVMRNYPSADSLGGQRTRVWMAKNQKLRRYILAEIRRHGPLPSRMLEEDGMRPKEWVSSGWTSGRNISRMLDFLWTGGKIMVAGRSGIQKLWDLTERCLPAWTPRERLTEREVVQRAAQRALRALGIATPQQIRYHFIRGRYPNLERTLADLEIGGRVKRVEVRDKNHVWPGVWYIHTDDLPQITDLQNAWEPRTTLLSPFDNLICDRARTKRLFHFDYTMEIYVPRHKRKYGYYVLPILHGDRLIGRMDPEMDRERGVLRLNAVYAEPDAPRSTGRSIARVVEDLAAFLGAQDILYNSRRVPVIWKRALLA
jgi:uncharacterized protein YcaQ